jgi:hypothetical protein
MHNSLKSLVVVDKFHGPRRKFSLPIGTFFNLGCSTRKGNVRGADMLGRVTNRTQARTLHDVAEERLPMQIAAPVILGLSLLSWAVLISAGFAIRSML